MCILVGRKIGNMYYMERIARSYCINISKECYASFQMACKWWNMTETRPKTNWSHILFIIHYLGRILKIIAWWIWHVNCGQFTIEIVCYIFATEGAKQYAFRKFCDLYVIDFVFQGLSITFSTVSRHYLCSWFAQLIIHSGDQAYEILQ